MMRKILSALLVMLGFLSVSAQQPQMTPLPLDPNVKSGKLANGLSYYILHNEEPKNRANFYIAQKVGSSLETPEQLGLAHFLEHMAFNGTEHYPGKNMLNYLQNKGIRFGADINAYTGFDETVYNINNVPANDQALMDSVLLVLFDWSGSILLEESEIDAERGVIQEEWRSRNNAQTRQYMSLLPQMYEEYQYEQMPIGKMEVVMNFKPEVLRAYYKKWYRPDQQGIVIVGDFDAAEMEKKVVDLFSKIQMPENAAERIYPHISDNEKPIYATFEDPELQVATIMVAFKSDPFPFEVRNTLENYLYNSVFPNLLAQMINTRLNDYSKKPECEYAYAGVYFGDYMVSSQKDAFNITIIPKGDIKSAFKSAMELIAQSCKTGFTDSELARAREDLLTSYEKMYNERDKTNSEARGRELIRHFIDNEPTPGIEMEYQLVQQILPSVPVQAFNEMSSQILTPNNQVIAVSIPSGSQEMPSEAEMTGLLNSAINAQYEMYVDEVISEPLIAKLPKPGKIKSTKVNSEFDTQEFTLSNGAKVVLKSTDFTNDEIQFTAYAKGGKVSYPSSQAANIELMGEAVESMIFGPFNQTRLEKYLAGKNASVSFGVGSYTNYFSGRSSVKDFKTMMELIYTVFTATSPDADTYNAWVSKAKPMLANQESNPMFVFQKEMLGVTFNNNPLMMPTTSATLDQANYAEMCKMYKEIVANAADYTFIFVGNIDAATLKPMLEQYIASLPSKGKPSAVKVVSNLGIVDGQVNKIFDIASQTPTVMVYDNIHQQGLEYNVENNIIIDILNGVLDNIYIATLREEEGGTYGAQVWNEFNPNTNVWAINWFVQTNADQQESIRKRAFQEFELLLQNGATPEQFTKVKEAQIKQLENAVRTNGYWVNNLLLNERGWNMITGYKEALDNLTLDKFNNFIKTVYNGQNRIEVVGIAQ